MRFQSENKVFKFLRGIEHALGIVHAQHLLFLGHVLLLSESSPLCSGNLLEEKAQHLVTAK